MEPNMTGPTDPTMDITGPTDPNIDMTGPTDQTIDGNTLAAMALARCGVTHMFGVVGIPVTGLANSAVAHGIRFIAFRNEQSAGYAASAYGFLTAGPSLLLTVSGPGCVHGLPGLSHSSANTWPMVMISGSCPPNHLAKGDFQALDQIQAVRPFSKFSVKPTTIRELPDCIAHVIAESLAGRPGGCYLDLPSDILHQGIEKSDGEDLISSAVSRRSFATSTWMVPEARVVDAVEMLRKAERPLVVFGKGAAYARAEDEARKFVEITGIPFLPTPMGKGLVPDTHERAATAARSLAIGKCDVVLVVGARLNWMLHFGEPPKWSEGVKFILVDICEEEIKMRKPEIGIVGDARGVLKVMNGIIKDNPFCFGRNHPWIREISEKVKNNVAKMEVQLGKEVVPFNFLTPMKIIRDEILKLGSPFPVVVSEGANTMDVGRSVLVQMEPRTRLDAGTWGTMGVGLGYCIAAALAEPERLVVAVEGDSGFGFSAMEVETLVRYRLPVVVIVFNNGGVYGGDRRKEEEITGPHAGDPAPTAFVSGAGYDRMMEAFGGKGYVAAEPEELRSALAEAFALRVPAVVNVIIDPFAGAESGRLQHKN